MSDSAQLTPSKAANTILRWIRLASGEAAAYTDLDMVREGLPGTPYGEGVKIIKPPMASPVRSSEGMLVCNPNDPTEWGIFVNEDASPERRRFTIAHELGHFVLHRAKRRTFNCDKAAVHLSLESAGVIEREADEFASNLLMPGDVLRDRITSQDIDLHLLSGLAKAFAVCARWATHDPSLHQEEKWSDVSVLRALLGKAALSWRNARRANQEPGGFACGRN